MKKITIIGGGATGTLLAVNLMRHNGVQPIEINLVEKKDRLGRGVAYSAATDFHLLNVPANKMGAFPEDIEHFQRWLTANGYDFLPHDFVPRRLYGEYLRDVFRETVENKTPNVAINLLDDEAVDILIDENQAQVMLNSGEILYTDKVVLAFGNFPPPHPKSENRSFISADKYFPNPWAPENIERIAPNDDVLIIGTGLTAVDSVLSLFNRRHAGKIFLFSTRGQLPAVHRLGFVYPSFYDELQSQTRVTGLLKTVRRHVELSQTSNSDWRAVIDSLRPHMQAIWLTLSSAEKRRFMRHASRYWNVARHRMPPQCREILDELQSAGQLQILKGRLKNIELMKSDRFDVKYSASGAEKNLSVDAIVNCMGSQSDFRRLKVPFVEKLINRGIVRTDHLALGLEALRSGEIIGRDGKISNIVCTAGTALKGVLWESTAMPEIRAQTDKLALSLIDQN